MNVYVFLLRWNADNDTDTESDTDSIQTHAWMHIWVEAATNSKSLAVSKNVFIQSEQYRVESRAHILHIVWKAHEAIKFRVNIAIKYILSNGLK